jgi:AcrR family transcriptional regulator
VSVSDICEEAGVAKGSFYFYFPRKEHLLVMLVFARMTPRESEIHALLESHLNTTQVCSEIAAIIATRARQLEKSLVQRGVEESFQHYREIGRLPGGDRNMRWYFHPVFVRGRERGEVLPGWDLETLATTMGWAILQGILFWSSNVVRDAHFEANLRQRAELIANGAGTSRKAATSPNRRTRALLRIAGGSGNVL